MSKEKKQIGVIIAPEWWESFAAMKDKDVAALVRAMIAWQGGDETPPSLPPVAAAIWPLMKAQQERNSISYNKTCEKRREAALKRWEMEKGKPGNMQSNANGCNSIDLHSDAMQNGTNGMQTDDNLNPNPNPNVSNDTVKKAKVSFADADFFPNTLNDEKFKAIWREWEQHRREIKHALKATQAQKQLAMLAGFSVEKAVEIIELSLLNGWQGLFPERIAENNRAGRGQNLASQQPKPQEYKPNPNRKRL